MSPLVVAPRIIAHRGASSVAPENTIASFDAALAAGADAIEVDLQLTADGVAVVIHDDRLDRTTDLVGSVADTDARSLASADAGSWFAPAFAGTRVPTFDNLIAWAVRHPETGWLLEFKGRWEERSLAPELEKVRLAGMVPRTVVQSFDVETVRALGATAPDVRLELLVSELPGLPARRAWIGAAEAAAVTPPGVADAEAAAVGAAEAAAAATAELVRLLGELGAAGCNPYGLLLVEHPELAADLRAAGYSVTPWTLDEPRQWELAVSAGVDGIITNRPQDLAAWAEGEGTGTGA
ncbi:glycerophosphodiester phosphodiesterase [Subtercola boreus]|uniref:glycerophosphodiester phosphodiesterase n=1 Tax=Subtercola boreus TaxID=120213 RepID=UPI0015585337|nr:glycerophosphodiester phosphodiesterase family protein [Subtercola boreus]